MAATETVEAPRVARRGWGLLDVLLATGIAALLAFPVLATIAADRLPLDAPAALPPLPAHAKPAALRDLPVGQQPGGDLRTAATALLGERRAARLLTLVRTGTTGNPVPGVLLTFSVSEGASVASPTATTGAAGTASVKWTLLRH